MDELKTKILNSCEELNKQGVFKNSLDYEKCKESVQQSDKKDVDFYNKIYKNKVDDRSKKELLDYNKFLKEFCVNYNKLTCEIPTLCENVDKDLLNTSKNCIPDKSKNVFGNLKSLKKLIKKKIKQKKNLVDVNIDKNNIYKDLVFKYKNFLDVQNELNSKKNNNVTIDRKNIIMDNKITNNMTNIKFYCVSIVILFILNLYIYIFLLK
jgi:hypothetical protein